MRISTIVFFLLLSVTAPHPVTAQTPLRVYISADMEGIGGLSATDDGLGRKLMTEEVNAAIAGAFAGGAMEVVVNDAHGSHTNLLQDLLDPRATLFRGSLKPYGMMQGLESDRAHPIKPIYGGLNFSVRCVRLPLLVSPPRHGQHPRRSRIPPACRCPSV